VTHFWTSAGPTGSGKTFAAVTFAGNRVARGTKSAFIQPTIALCKQSYDDAIKRFPGIREQVKTIVTRRGSADGIAHRITSYLNDRDETGDLLFVTHAGFLRTPHWHRPDTWNLFVDEAIEVTYHRKFRLRRYRHLLTDLFHLRPSRHERYGILEPHDFTALDEILEQMDDDEIYEHFADFAWRLRHGHWNLYVDHEEFTEFQCGQTHTLEVHGLLAPSIFEAFASVTIMGANLADSIMLKFFAREGCIFSQHKAIDKALRYQTHDNGSRLVIKYLADRKWSKTLRNSELGVDGSCDFAESICDVYMGLCQQEAARHSRLPPLWIANTDIRDDEFEGMRLKNVPHGMNGYKMHEVCCIFSALNPPQAHRKFIQDMCGMTEREVRRALLSQTAYQACGRGILRDPTSTGTFLLIVPDRDTADDIAQYYPGCRIERLISDIKEPKIGRPAKYDSEMERMAARREQDRLRKRVVRKKSLKYNVFADMGTTPDQVRSSLVHVLDEWAGLTPDTTGTSSFSFSRWQNKFDRIGQGNVAHTPADLVSDLRRRQGIEWACKEASFLICPTIFEKPLELPEHLTAIGISIEAPVRTKEKALACRGLLLDFENGDMTPDDFAQVFPNLEFIAHSSWSHTPKAPRFRIGIPITQFVRPDTQVLLLHSLVDRLEAAGWGDALFYGRKHGVDIGKLHEAAMFYLPSQRPDCFLRHFTEGRKPLNPREWVSMIADDLLVSPPPAAPTELYFAGEGPVRDDIPVSRRKDELVQWAIDYWRGRGCVKGKGRTQLWLLAKRLAAAGCDEQEMRTILDKQAGFATNPEERRGEIERLLRDHAVVAAKQAA
jgi:hypothetical protein